MRVLGVNLFRRSGVSRRPTSQSVGRQKNHFGAKSVSIVILFLFYRSRPVKKKKTKKIKQLVVLSGVDACFEREETLCGTRLPPADVRGGRDAETIQEVLTSAGARRSLSVRLPAEATEVRRGPAPERSRRREALCRSPAARPVA